MIELYYKSCSECSQLITNNYSSSFSMGIRLFDKKFRRPIYGIYAFVRFADEIVDTFHQHDKEKLLTKFRQDTYDAIQDKISLNPVLQAYQEVVNEYNIGKALTDAFLDSMAMDLNYKNYRDDLYKKYIYGSAEVVGLMCLKVFCEGDEKTYNRLKDSARSLGSAFQKLNFLRDMKSDYQERGRVYFPGVDFNHFSAKDKAFIEADIKADFDHAYQGIVQLPEGAKFGVYLAYVYYQNLFKKIRNSSVQHVKKDRIRVNDAKKLFLLCRAGLKSSLNLI